MDIGDLRASLSCWPARVEGPVMILKMIEGSGDDSDGDNADTNIQNPMSWPVLMILMVFSSYCLI